MQPNVLIIMCDQLAASVLSCYGGPVQTPNIDRLAARGVVFDNAICPFPVCSPSRASLVTGRYPHSHGIIHNVNKREYTHAAAAPATEEGIRSDDITTEAVLNSAGYQTHHYGKWHLLDDDLPYYTDMFSEHGAYAEAMADTFAAIRSRPRDSWMDWYGWALPVDVQPDIHAARPSLAQLPLSEFIAKMGRLDLPVSQCFDAMVAEHVVQRLENLGPEPFMLTCSFNAPHDPNVAPNPYYDAINPDDITLPANADSIDARFDQDLSHRVVQSLGQPGVREFLRVYHAMVRMVDDHVGRVLGALHATGRADDTIVVFTADHGDMVGAHGMVWKSTHAFYDEVVRVPLIISHPATITPRRSSLAAGLVDLMPTLLDLTGAPVPDDVDGHSLRDHLSGAAPDVPRYRFCERWTPDPAHRRAPHTAKPIGKMVRGCGWKYIRYADGEEFLYDLRADPHETTNLAQAAEHLDRRHELRDELDRFG